MGKKISNFLIAIDGSKVYRMDRLSKGDGVAMYVKSKFTNFVTLSITKFIMAIKWVSQ